MDVPFLTKLIGGIVVMCRVQAEVPDRDIRMNGFKFPEGDDGTDAVMSSGIQKTDMQRQVNTDLCIVGAEHIKHMPKIEGLLVTVPSPVGIRIGEMAFSGTMEVPSAEISPSFKEGRIAARRKTSWSLSL